MRQHFHLLVDVASDNRKHQQQVQHIHDILTNFQVTYLTYTSTPTSDVRALVNQIICHHHPHTEFAILVLGDDTTLNQVVATLMDEGLKIPLAFIPLDGYSEFAHRWITDARPRVQIEGLIYHRIPQQIPILRYRDKKAKNSGVVLKHLSFGLEASLDLNYSAFLSKYPLIARWSGRRFLYGISFFTMVNHLSSFDTFYRFQEEDSKTPNCQAVSVTNHPFKVTEEASPIILKIIHGLSSGKATHLLRQQVGVSTPKNTPYSIHEIGERLTLQISQSVPRQVDGLNLNSQASSLTFAQEHYPFYV